MQLPNFRLQFLNFLVHVTAEMMLTYEFMRTHRKKRQVYFFD